MPLTRENTKTFYERLYKGWTYSVTLLKRGNDQLQGTVTSHLIFNARRKKVYKSGEPLQGNESSDNRTVWQLPLVELQRVGITYLNALDRIIDEEGDYWEPESDTEIVFQLYNNYQNVSCKKTNPPGVG